MTLKLRAAALSTLVLLSQSALAGETRGVGSSQASVVADVADAQLDEDVFNPQFQITYGTMAEGDGKAWANGITMNCGRNGNGIFVNGAAQFGFRTGNVDESIKAKVDFFTEENQIRTLSARGLTTWKHGFSVWVGMDAASMLKTLDGLQTGQIMDFRIGEAGTDLRDVSVSLVGYEGHNNLSAFRKLCVSAWKQPSVQQQS